VANLSAISGAPLLVIVYISNLFLTNFGLNLYPSYFFFLVYGTFYILYQLSSGQGLYIYNKRVFIWHLVLLFYSFIVFYLFELGLFERESLSWWSTNSLFKFFSIIIGSLVVIVTPYRNILKSIQYIKNISYFMIFGAFLFYFLTPLGISFFSSDELAGHRYNGGINSYIVAGQFLIIGLVSHLFLNQRAKLGKLLLAVLLFLFGILATKDRTSILGMLVVLCILLYRSGFGISPFNFSIRKYLVVLLIAPTLSIFAAIQYQDLSSGNYEAYKSTLYRIAISIRSIEMFQDVFPIGAGPGSQTFMMLEERIKGDFLDEGEEEGSFAYEIIRNVEGFQASVGTGSKLSPHNTYVDFLVPLGALGMLFVLSVLSIQLSSLKKIFLKKDNPTTILDSFFVSGLVIFMFSSLFNLWWIYLIFYRLMVTINHKDGLTSSANRNEL